jgi:hypothetical protein
LEEDVITQEQLDDFDKWMESRPDFPSEEFKEWLESRPDIELPFGTRYDGEEKPFGKVFRHFRGFGGGFRDRCQPDSSEE